MRQDEPELLARSGDDLIQPFLLEVPHLRGRLARLGPLIDRILSRHDYPDPVARHLGEMLTLTALLANMLKYEGVFSLQTKGDGPVPMMVSDMTSEGELRGYAATDPERLAQLSMNGASNPITAKDLLGEGYLAFTVDQGLNTQRYQGIVELTGPDLAASVQHYFRQSEQLKTGIRVAVGRLGGTWRAGGLLLQEIPREQSEVIRLGSTEEDDWRRNLVLMSSCSDRELLDAELEVNDLLYRLFHDEQVRVYRPRALATGCRCSRERIETVLRAMSDEQLEEMKVGGEVTVTCQFCNLDYRFDEKTLQDLRAS